MIKDPCPCPRDSQGRCPCDQNIAPIALDTVNSAINLAGNTILGGSITGQPNPALGALGGAISGFSTGGVPGAIFGALGGFGTAGQAREDYERHLDIARNRYLLDRKFMPETAEDGGLFGDILQTEVGESLVLPSLEISKVKAKKKHKDMEAHEVTDVVQPGTIVFSAKKTFNPEKYKDFKLSEAISFYDDKDTYDFQELTVGDILGDGKKMSFADAIKKVKKYYPTSDQKSKISEETNKMNLAARQSIISFLYSLQNGDKPIQPKSGVHKAEGGFDNLDELLKIIQLNNSYTNRGEPLTNDPLYNGTLGPQINLQPQIDTVDPLPTQQPKPLQMPVRKSILDSLTGGQPTSLDSVMVTLQNGEPSPQAQAPSDSNPETLEELMSRLRSGISRKREDLNVRHVSDQADIKSLVRGKHLNNALQLGNQILFSGLQSGYMDPALESTSLIDDQFREIPAAIVDQQADAIGRGANSVVQALSASGLSPGEIASYAARTTDSVIDAQGRLRSGVLERDQNLNRAKIKEYRDVIQGNNQKLADSANYLTDFNNKRLSSIGSYVNDFLTNKDRIRDVDYTLNSSNATDYAKAIGALDKANDQTYITEYVNRGNNNTPVTSGTNPNPTNRYQSQPGIGGFSMDKILPIRDTPGLSVNKPALRGTENITETSFNQIKKAFDEGSINRYDKDSIIQIQNILNRSGLANIKEDGIYNPATQEALRKFLERGERTIFTK